MPFTLTEDPLETDVPPVVLEGEVVVPVLVLLDELPLLLPLPPPEEVGAGRTSIVMLVERLFQVAEAVVLPAFSGVMTLPVEIDAMLGSVICQETT